MQIDMETSLTALEDMICGLQTVIDQTGSYIFTKDTAGRYTYVNQRVQDLFGTTFNAIVGKDDSHFFDLTLSNELRINDRRVIDLGETIMQEERNIVKPSGEERIYWAIKKPVRSALGEIIGLCGISTDITERKSAELAMQQVQNDIRDTEEKYRVMFEFSEDPMWLIVENRFEVANQAAARVLGYDSVAALTNTHPAKLSPEFQPDGKSSFEAANMKMATAYEQGYHRFEWTHQRKNGEDFSVEVTLTRIPYARGDALYCVWRDITERKKLEVDLRIAAAAFNSHEGLMITDAKSQILRVNQAFCDITGYSAEEVIGQTPRVLLSTRHDADFYRVMWKTINTKGGWEGEVWDRRKNGEIYPKWLSISAVKDEHGVVSHYIGVQHDITARKQSEEKINAQSSAEIP